MESIASTRRVASRVWLEGMASAAVCPCAEAQRRIGTGISHGCGRLPLRRIAAGQRYGHFAWVRTSIPARRRCGAMVPASHMGASVRPARRRSGAMVLASRIGASVHPCAEALWRNGTGISHGCERPSLRGGAAAHRYRHLTWVRASTLARKRCGAMVPVSHGCGRSSCAEALRGNGSDISHGCGRSSCAKALRRNGVGISHGCERLPLARRRRIPVLCRRPRCALSGGDIPLPEVCARRCLEGRGVLGRSLEIYATEQRRNICQFARSSMARKRTDPSACGAPTPANSLPT